MTRWQIQLLIITLSATALVNLPAQDTQARWLAGDSHIHSHWSADYDETTNPPTDIIGIDGRYSTPVNAYRARRYGLEWMVTTDHGGPNHSKLNLTRAYAELRASREMVPEVLQFYGMELNMAAMDHHTVIIPNSPQEAAMLLDIESRFDAQEAWPRDPARDTEEAAVRALEHMRGLPMLPLVFANHPSRSAKGIGVYGRDEPREIRRNNTIAPDVYRGMEGAPGHQAAALAPDGSQKRGPSGAPAGFRGSYGNAGAHTLGGFDQMTAIVGGFWDSMLGEGRRFWIVATSDSHAHYADEARAGSDFWPGEYQKTYVHAVKSYTGILDGLRAGRMFAVAGDLIAQLDVEARVAERSALAGATVAATRGEEVTVTVRFRDPEAKNVRGHNPRVARVDVIVGDIVGPSVDPTLDRNPTTKVVGRFESAQWHKEGDLYSFSTTLPRLDRSIYVRIRGTSTTDLEPPMDQPGEDPWTDLWFYSNPIFVEVAARP